MAATIGLITLSCDEKALVITAASHAFEPVDVDSTFAAIGASDVLFPSFDGRFSFPTFEFFS